MNILNCIQPDLNKTWDAEQRQNWALEKNVNPDSDVTYHFLQ